MNTKYLLLPLAALSWPLMAEQVEQDENVITVTADYRESSKDDTTASVSVLNAEDLKQAAEQHLEEVINLIPNLNWAGGSSRPKFFQIRGIGELDQYEGAPNPSVAMIIDDIDFSSMGMLATLFDIDQVEVLRGPQSARYGANAIAGMINVRSRDPQAENELRSQFILGEDSTYGVALSASGSLSDDNTVMGLISVDQYMNNGFRYNNYLNTDDTNARDEFNLRAKLRWLPADNHELKLTLIKSELDNGYDVWALDNTYLTRTDKPGVDAQQTDAFSARYQMHLHIPRRQRTGLLGPHQTFELQPLVGNLSVFVMWHVLIKICAQCRLRISNLGDCNNQHIACLIQNNGGTLLL